jgi:formylglycine-generating enzyme required for sulfatase activity
MENDKSLTPSNSQSLSVLQKVQTQLAIVEKIKQELANPMLTSARFPFEPEMIFVEGGTFQMGCNDYEENEQPIHSVTLSSFNISKYQLTQKQWEAVMGSNPSYFKGDDLPVEEVSWNDVQEYIKKLNEKTGKTYRLPTETEWEFAARGGNKSKGYQYAGSDTPSDIAWFSENSDNKTQPVGTKKPNELGIYDMSGNVWEWCSDWYGDYSTEPQTNPKGAETGSYRVLRGSSWFYDAVLLRVASRGYYTPANNYNNLGFRLVCL